MPAPKVDDNTFIAIWNDGISAGRSISDLAHEMGYTMQHKLYARKARLETKYGAHTFLIPNGRKQFLWPTNTARIDHRGEYLIAIGSDVHIWPGYTSPAMAVWLQVLADLQPAVVVLNGDILDGATIGRWPRIGWDAAPTLKDELDAVKLFLAETEQATTSAQHIRTVGNHDMRFDSRLSGAAPEYEGIAGTRLADHLPTWEECMSCVAGDIMIKHRLRGGIHAARNNVIAAGTHIVTGHLHRLNSRPFTTYRGTHFGMECGTLADPQGPQFAYTEHNPLDWQPGFLLLTVRDHRLIGREEVHVQDGEGRCFGKVYRG